MIKKLLWCKVKNNRVIEKFFSTNLNLEIKLDEHGSSCAKVLMSYEKKFHKYQHKIIFFSQENIYSQNHLAF